MNRVMNAIGIDLGGTNVKTVLINHLGDVLANEIVPIHESDWQGAVHEAFTKITAAHHEYACIGLAAPGLPDRENRYINFMPGRLDGP